MVKETVVDLFDLFYLFYFIPFSDGEGEGETTFYFMFTYFDSFMLLPLSDGDDDEDGEATYEAPLGPDLPSSDELMELIAANVRDSKTYYYLRF